MDTEKVQAISFESRIRNIDIIDFIIHNNDKKQKLKSKDFAFEFNIDINLEADNNIITMNLLVKIFSNLSKEILLSELKSEGIFEVINYKELIESFNGMPNAVLSTFAGVLVSTTRGFLILKAKDTIINGAIFPMIDPSQFFNKKI